MIFAKWRTFFVTVNLKHVTMTVIYIFIYFLINLLLTVNCDEEYIPTLVWTSHHFQDRTLLAENKIKSDLFESYLTEVLANRKPLIVIFLEQILNPDDFKWKDDKGYNSYPFLNSLSTESRVDYLRNVEAPYQSLINLTQADYQWENFQPETNVNSSERVFLVEFPEIDDQRPRELKKHDEIMEKIHKQLQDLEKEWICIYTAKHTNEEELSVLKQLSPWHIDQPFPEKPMKALSLYQDFYTGFTLITRGSIQLILPSRRKYTVNNLENYFEAKTKQSGNKIDFIITFTNYTLIFHLKQINDDWIINEVKILNENGNTLHLPLKAGDLLPSNKCYVHVSEFQSQGKPIVKVKLSKYKFTRLPLHEEICVSPYNFQIISSFMFVSILTVVLFWNHLFKDFKIKRRPSNIVRVSANKLFSFN